MKHIYMSSKHKERRVRVIERLENQLKSGVKGPTKIPLSESDVERIKNEITILKTRI